MSGTPLRREGEHAPIPFACEKDADILSHFPSLVLRKRPTGVYLPTSISTLNTIRHVGFDKNGRITIVHPRLVLFFIRMFCNLRGIRISSTDLSPIYSGPPRKLRAGHVVDILQRIQTFTTNVVGGECHASACQETNAPIYPQSAYVMGRSVCHTCMSHFITHNNQWFTMGQIETLFSEGFRHATFSHWRSKPLKYILIGLVIADTLDDDLSLLDDYDVIGRRFCEWPPDMMFHLWNGISRTDLKKFSYLAGPLTWRQLTDLHTQYPRIQKLMAPYLHTDLFQKFGWHPLPIGTRIIHDRYFGTPITSIDDPENSEDERPLYILKTRYYRGYRYVIMKSSTYLAWRTMLTTARVEIYACHDGFQPYADPPAIDGSKSMVASMIPTEGSVVVYNAHCLSWGGLLRLLRATQTRSLILHGSIYHGLNSDVSCFADILLTFRFLHSLPSAYKDNVIIHAPGPGLRPIGLDKGEHEDLETAFLKSTPTLLPPPEISHHSIWRHRVTFLMLMKGLCMHPMVNHPIPLELMAPLYPKITTCVQDTDPC